MVNHMGSLRGGHYTATILYQGNTWYEFDDTRIYKVRILLTYPVWQIFKTYKKINVMVFFILFFSCSYERCRLKSNHLQKPGLTSMLDYLHFTMSDIAGKRTALYHKVHLVAVPELLIVSQSSSADGVLYDLSYIFSFLKHLKELKIHVKMI